MNEVEIKIDGFHLFGDDNENLGFVTDGTYYEKNGKHYVLYEEITKEDTHSKIMLKISKDTIEMIRYGYGSTHLIFQTDRKYKTFYRTIAGNLEVEIDTGVLNNEFGDQYIRAYVEYSLMINQVKTSDCRIKIEVNCKNGYIIL